MRSACPGFGSALLLAAALLGGCESGPAPSASSASPRPPRTPMKAGVGKADITPLEPIRLSGYAARSKPSTGVEQPLFARAVAFEDAAGIRAVIVSVDAIGISADLADAAAAKVAAAHGIPREQIAVATTHSHCAPQIPMYRNLFEHTPAEWAAVERYVPRFVDGIAAACDAAVKDLAPAELALGWTAAGFAKNRRMAGGPVDPDVPVLRVTAPGGKLRAVLFGYACHCTSMGAVDKVFGDWAGCAAEALEKAHPGIVAPVVIGCGADANPLACPQNDFEVPRRYGRDLAGAVDALLASGEWRPVRGPILGGLARPVAPFEKLPSREDLEKTLKESGNDVVGAAQKRRARHLLDKLEKDGKLPDGIPCTVQTLTFGRDLVMVFLAGEVVVDYSLRIRRELDDVRTWVVAYANDVPGYIPSERILAEGGYEGGDAMLWYLQPGKFAKGVEDILVKQVHAFVPDGFRRKTPEEPVKPPISPADSLTQMEVQPGFVVEIAAAEPVVSDPVHLSWDARGRMYVVAMNDYPLRAPKGRVLQVTDTDGDGVYDKSTVFAEGFTYPNSSLPWRNGLFVSEGGGIVYVEDADDDGRAEIRKPFFTGFNNGNPQHHPNGLQWGPDGWIYGGNIDAAGKILSPAHPDRKPVATGADFRFRPGTGDLEPTSAGSNYSSTFNDAGDLIGCGAGADYHLKVFARKVLDRSDFVPGVPVVHGFHGHGGVHTISGPSTRYNHPEAAGSFTAASGVTWYRGGIFPAHYSGNLFIGENAGNVIHRDVPVPAGPLWSVAPYTGPREFIASRDPWFRPVFLTTGPDGCLYAADMYRNVVEHPEWIPDDIQAKTDLDAGNDRGRVYRIRHRSTRPLPFRPLDGMPSAELVAQLASPNGWTRDTAQRLIRERGGREAVPALAALAKDHPNPLARHHALWTLENLSSLDGAVVKARLADADPLVRESAVQLAEPVLNKGVALADLLPLKDDPSVRVRFRLALLLGGRTEDEAVDEIARLLFDKGTDEWVRHAARRARADVADRLLAGLVRRIGSDEAEAQRMIPDVWRLTRSIGARNDDAQVRAGLDLCLPKPGAETTQWQMVGLGGGIIMGIGQGNRTPGKRMRELAEGIPDGPARLEKSVQDAAAMSEDPKVKQGTRYDALRMLALDDAGAHRGILTKYLDPGQPGELQDGAIGGVSDLDAGAEAAGLLLANWSAYEPGRRSGVLDAVFRRPDRQSALLDALEAGKIRPLEIDDGRREQLRRHPDESVRKRAESLLAAPPSDRAKVVEEKKAAVLALTGRRKEGTVVFERVCAACHPIEGRGNHVGPDLVRVRTRTPDALLLDILDPNAAMEPNFVVYRVRTKEEVIHSGLLVAQSPAAVTLRQSGGKDVQIPRGDIDAMESTGKSLMLEGMEKELSDQDLADVIAFIRLIQ